MHFQPQDDVQEIFRGQSDAEFTSRADPKNFSTASVIRGGTNVFLMHPMEQTMETLSQNARIMENLGENFKAFLEQKKNPCGQVVNLSKKAFSKYEYSLLNKGLNFCPTPKQYNRASVNKDLEKFFEE